jgi:magnesium chelatase family protein
MEKLNLSDSAYDRILKASRTIADLKNETAISPNPIAEALQYRSLDNDSWLGKLIKQFSSKQQYL